MCPFSFVLAKKPACKKNGNDTSVISGYKQDYIIQVVPWVQQDNVKLVELSEEGSFNGTEEKSSLQFRENFLRQLASTNKNITTSNNDPQNLLKRKNVVKQYLKDQHQLTVTEDETQTLIIQDLVTLRPPYTSENCEGTNEIVLDRVRHLIEVLEQKD